MENTGLLFFIIGYVFSAILLILCTITAYIEEQGIGGVMAMFIILAIVGGILGWVMAIFALSAFLEFVFRGGLKNKK